MNTRIPLLFAAFQLYAACAFSQSSLIRRSAEEGVLYVDPRGIRPSSINAPLPYRRWEPTLPCVKDHAVLADYYHWKENEGWSYAYSSGREFDKNGHLLVERIFNRTNKEVLAEYRYRYDEQGRMTFADRFESEALDGVKSHEQEYFTYESSSGILLRDSLAEQTAEGWKTAAVRWWKPYRDDDGRLLTMTASAYEGRERSEDVISRLEYSGDVLNSITQSVFHFGLDAPLPAFRYVRSSGSSEPMTEFSSSLYSNGQWVEFRKDRSGSDNGMDWFQGEILSPEDDNGAHRNELEYDLKGNLIRTSQSAYSRSNARWETVADLRFIIEYVRDGNEPSSVITTRRDSSGNTHNSVKVVYNPTRLPLQDARLVAYPNPAYGIVRINWEGMTTDPSRLQVTDETGKTVVDRLVKSAGSGDETIDFSKFPSGNYSVRLVAGRQVLSTSVIIAH